MKEAQKLDFILKELIRDIDENPLASAVGFYDSYEKVDPASGGIGLTFYKDLLEKDGMINCTQAVKNHFSDNKDDYDYYVVIIDKARDFINEGGYTQKEKAEREQQELLRERKRLEISNAKRQAVLIEREENKPIQKVVFQKADGANPLVDLHPKVQEVANKLFEDGHFSEAVLKAYISLVEAVRDKSRQESDGTQLMQKVFSKENPILKISDSHDERLGFMWLFSGAVMGIRNPKAHRILDQEDPQRALEWIAFASVLFRVLDDSELV